MQLTTRILNKVQRQGEGWVFSSADFLNFKHRNSIDKLLSRLCARGEFISIDRGYYHFPKFCENGKVIPPTIGAIADCLSRKICEPLHVGPNECLDFFGLKKQKTDNIIFFSNGASRVFKIAGHQIQISHTKVPIFKKNIQNKSLMAVLALVSLGASHCSLKKFQLICNQLDLREKAKVRYFAKHAPKWVLSKIHG
jgi:hypothetical protein